MPAKPAAREPQPSARDSDAVTIRISQQDYEGIRAAIATSYWIAIHAGDRARAQRFLRLANTVTESRIERDRL